MVSGRFRTLGGYITKEQGKQVDRLVRFPRPSRNIATYTGFVSSCQIKRASVVSSLYRWTHMPTRIGKTKMIVIDGINSVSNEKIC